MNQYFLIILPQLFDKAINNWNHINAILLKTTFLSNTIK
jgi:hypothetical protein